MDESTFTEARLRQFLAEAPDPRLDRLRNLPREWTRFHKQYGNVISILWLLIVAAWLIRPHRAPWVAAYVLYVLAGLVGLQLVYRLPPRIGGPLFLLAFAGVAYLFEGGTEPIGQPASPRRRFLSAAFLWVVGVLIAWGWLIWLGDLRRQSSQGRRAFDQAVHALRELPSGSLFVIQPAAGVEWEFMSPFSTRAAQGIPSVPLGWSTFSPLFYQVLHDGGVARGSDLVRATIDNPRWYYVIHDMEFSDMLTRFTREHAGVAAGLELVQALPNGSRIYRLATAGAAGESRP